MLPATLFFLLLVCVLLLFRFLSLLALVLYRNNVTPMLLRKLQCLRRLVPSVALASTRLRGVELMTGFLAPCSSAAVVNIIACYTD